MIEDRSMLVQPDEIVVTAWVPVEQCILGCRDRMDFAAIERAGRKLLQIGRAQTWPPIVGEWKDGQLVVMDGRHEFLAALALGREKVFVAWREKRT
jgi:hypothetical protein